MKHLTTLMSRILLSGMLFVSCDASSPIIVEQPSHRVVYVQQPSYTYYWMYSRGQYYRRTCPRYYSPRPYYWGGPRRYYHHNWAPPHRPPHRPYTHYHNHGHHNNRYRR